MSFLRWRSFNTFQCAFDLGCLSCRHLVSGYEYMVRFDLEKVNYSSLVSCHCVFSVYTSYASCERPSFFLRLETERSGPSRKQPARPFKYFRASASDCRHVGHRSLLQRPPNLCLPSPLSTNSDRTYWYLTSSYATGAFQTINP